MEDRAPRRVRRVRLRPPRARREDALGERARAAWSRKRWSSADLPEPVLPIRKKGQWPSCALAAASAAAAAARARPPPLGRRHRSARRTARPPPRGRRAERGRGGGGGGVARAAEHRIEAVHEAPQLDVAAHELMGRATRTPLGASGRYRLSCSPRAPRARPCPQRCCPPRGGGRTQSPSAWRVVAGAARSRAGGGARVARGGAVAPRRRGRGRRRRAARSLPPRRVHRSLSSPVGGGGPADPRWLRRVRRGPRSNRLTSMPSSAKAECCFACSAAWYTITGSALPLTTIVSSGTNSHAPAMPPSRSIESRTACRTPGATTIAPDVLAPASFPACCISRAARPTLAPRVYQPAAASPTRRSTRRPS